MGGTRFSVLIACVFTSFYYPLVYWTLRGMEVGLLTLTLNLAIYYSMKLADRFEHRYNILISVLLILGLLIRPDAIIFL